MEQITAKTPWAGHTEDIPLHLDYFELCPKEIYDNPVKSEDIW